MLKLQDEQETEELKTEELETEEVQLEESPPPPTELRTLGLFGDVSEKKSEEIIYALLLLANESKEDVEFYISSTGGTAVDMFAMYDVMRSIREEVDLVTIGVGKVMSAAVILLASGTKGKRKIGRHCRVMLHSVISSNQGALKDLRSELQEVEYTQNLYTKVLCEETKLTKEKIDEIISQNINAYLSAEEAVEYGIADEIV